MNLETARTNPGWIYLLKAEGRNQYKIGRSSVPIIRLAALEKQSRTKVKLEHVFFSADMVAGERSLHQRFATYRVQGEWFKLPQEAVEYICSLEAV